MLWLKEKCKHWLYQNRHWAFQNTYLLKIRTKKAGKENFSCWASGEDLDTPPISGFPLWSVDLCRPPTHPILILCLHVAYTLLNTPLILWLYSVYVLPLHWLYSALTSSALLKGSTPNIHSLLYSTCTPVCTHNLIQLWTLLSCFVKVTWQ